MNKEILFPTPVWYDSVDFNREEILDFCYENKKIDPTGRKLSNFGGWQSDNLNIESSQTLIDFFYNVIKKCESAFKDIGPNFKATVGNTWININGPYDFNRYHYHSNSCLSGVVYLNVDEDSGDLVFYNPTYQEHYPFYNCDENPLFFKNVRFKPRNNMMLLFPSWIAHEVLSSPNSNVERISISFNFLQQLV